MERTADHHLTVLSSVPAGPKWSFGSRGRSTSAAPSPGPGAYEPTLRVSSPSAPSYGFGNEPRGKTTVLTFPGPGTYNTVQKPNTKNAPQWTMPGRKAAKQIDYSPGPGAYDAKLSSTSPSYAVGSEERKIVSAPNTPGPGAYNPLYIAQASPQWGYAENSTCILSMGSGNRSGALGIRKDASMPGPGAYTLPSKLQTGPQYSMGARGECKPREGTPGPGAYQAIVPGKDSGKYSFGMKTPTITFGGNIPGPGAYSLPIAARSHSPQWTFGSQDRSSKAVSGTPGPGQYDPLQSARKHPPAWSFGGVGERSIYSKSDSPAPGTYNISSRLGEGAKNPNKDGGKLGSIYTTFGY